MKLNKHIAYNLLMDRDFPINVILRIFPEIKSAEEILKVDKDSKLGAQISQQYSVLSNQNNKSYYITESVTDKLDLLKVKRDKEFGIRNNDEKEIIGSVITYDWTVFKTIKSLNDPNQTKKFTYILPDNSVIRLCCSSGYLGFNHFWTEDVGFGLTDISFCMFWFNMSDGIACSHWRHPDVQRVEEYIYKLMCFIYLSENEELLVQAGSKYGTKKSGKVINSLNVPITIVTSKWNVTSVRTEGFDVSGHFRLQPYTTGVKMILIQPFRKYGYIRKAKSLE